MNANKTMDDCKRGFVSFTQRFVFPNGLGVDCVWGSCGNIAIDSDVVLQLASGPAGAD